MKENLRKFFARDFSEGERVASYDYIETYISDNVSDWSAASKTDKLAAGFAVQLKSLDDSDFAFLLSHSGYIPEFYEHDSSQETLYSKLIEVLVCEWAVRVGFGDSHFQKQKASKEDVTIKVKNIVIVADAKSYRLGRSQSAPNVKDTIKKADYEKWQLWWHETDPDPTYGEFRPIGGLITFPSQHRWKGASDAYLYSTDKEKPIVIIYYEYLAYFLMRGYRHGELVNLIESYPDLFPDASKDQHKYFETILKFLFHDAYDGDFQDFVKLYTEIIKEKVANTIMRIERQLELSKAEIADEIEIVPLEELKALLIDSRLHNKSGQLLKQLVNIKKFRSL